MITTGSGRGQREGAPARVLRAFHTPGFRRLWLASVLSAVARSMQAVLLTWFVLERTNSPWSVALVGFFIMVPVLALGLLSGTLVDRVSRQRLLVGTLAVNLLAGLAMTVLLVTGVAQVWHAYLIASVAGGGWAIEYPARGALLPDLLGRSGLTNAVALDSAGAQATRTVGPAVAGGLITVAGVPGGYVVVTAVYVLVVLLLLRLKEPPRASSVDAPRRVLKNFLDGVRYVRRERGILATIAVSAVVNFLLVPYHQMVPVIARDVLHVGPGLMGMLLSAEGLGAFLASGSIAGAAQVSHHWRIYVSGALLAMVALLIFSFSTRYSFSLPLLLVLGLGIGGFGTMQATIIMMAARDEMRGRALGVLTLAMGTGPYGALLMGGVASALSPSFAVRLNAGLGIALILLLALFARALWRGGPKEERLRAA